jgi:hypothetical protein
MTPSGGARAGDGRWRADPVRAATMKVEYASAASVTAPSRARRNTWTRPRTPAMLLLDENRNAAPTTRGDGPVRRRGRFRRRIRSRRHRADEIDSMMAIVNRCAVPGPCAATLFAGLAGRAAAGSS